MVRLLQTNDVVLGSRLKGSVEPGAMTTMSVVGNILLSAIARLLFNARFSDICTRLWGYQGDAVKCLVLSAQGFEIEADMLTECMHKRLRIAEIPIHYGARKGQAKLSSVRDGLRIGAFLLQKCLRRADGRGSRPGMEKHPRLESERRKLYTTTENTSERVRFLPDGLQLA